MPWGPSASPTFSRVRRGSGVRSHRCRSSRWSAGSSPASWDAADLPGLEEAVASVSGRKEGGGSPGVGGVWKRRRS